MLTEDDLAEVALASMEPEQRFRCLEQLVAKKLVAERTYEGEQFYDDYDYMTSVLEAARICGITELTNWELPPRIGSGWETECRNFRGEATRVSQRILFKYASRPTKDPNTVAFDPATKKRLRFHLQQMRDIVDNDAAPDWKKQDFYDAIADLEREIDKSRTRLAAVLELVGKTVEGSEPITDAVRKIVMIVQDAKIKENDQALLAPPVETKRIEGPSSNGSSGPKTSNGGFDTPLDDEIPF